MERVRHDRSLVTNTREGDDAYGILRSDPIYLLLSYRSARQRLSINRLTGGTLVIQSL